ncbi:hypothetical protein C5Y93_05300 [Blastopirellula marina]|uniref:Uncharacterized protein n=2 Tax=Blastopirellula marina TaxID=124 RepID=A0A2S8GSR8_9BACT|nr:hypothetical protein C5Y93_05300 [Blastopirellula marina]
MDIPLYTVGRTNIDNREPFPLASDMKMRWRRTPKEMAAEFAKTRTPQSDDEFFRACDLPDDDLARQSALAVRRTTAAYGRIDPEFIRPTDRYPEELTNLTGWDKIDFVDWLAELEAMLDETLSDNADQWLALEFSVKELVQTTDRIRRGET